MCVDGYIPVIHALGGAMSRAFSTGRALICRCSKKLSASCSNGSFLECLPLTEEALVRLLAGRSVLGPLVKNGDDLSQVSGTSL